MDLCEFSVKYNTKVILLDYCTCAVYMCSMTNQVNPRTAEVKFKLSPTGVLIV